MFDNEKTKFMMEKCSNSTEKLICLYLDSKKNSGIETTFYDLQSVVGIAHRTVRRGVYRLKDNGVVSTRIKDGKVVITLNDVHVVDGNVTQEHFEVKENEQPSS